MSIAFDQENTGNYGKVVSTNWQALPARVGVGASFVDVLIYDAVPKQTNTDILVDFFVPAKNDYNYWGGGYLEPYYSEDDGVTWISVGHTGHYLCMSYPYGVRYPYNRDSHSNSFLLTGLTTDTIRIKLQARSHNSTLYVNGNNGSDAGTDGYARFQSNIILTELEV